MSENVIANPGDDATLSCTVEGKPLSEEHVRWERLGYEMNEKTTVTFVNGTSYLHIKNARREDVGNFRCIADNRVANPTSRDVLLVVKCKFSTQMKFPIVGAFLRRSFLVCAFTHAWTKFIFGHLIPI